ncbi:MAG: hypothetical protein P4L52_05835 [Acidocella sp.]|nr:hypothetical protein [Acidocella sp.]
MLKRRDMFSGLALAAMLARKGQADNVSVTVAAPPLTLLVAGPDGQQTSRWGDACALAMSGCFPGNPAINTMTVGGLDGVTGANRLDALVVPDGKTAAILPGVALTAFLCGDSRVHFDPTRWTPLLAGGNSGVLMVRAAGGVTPDLKLLKSLAPLRLGADSPQSADLAALLALARIGVATAPVFGLRDTAAKTRAFIAGEVDAVFISGEGVPEDLAPLSASGAVPAFSLGAMDASGRVTADPLFPSLPDALAFGPGTEPFLDAAYAAAAVAARLDFLLVLPRLTDSNSVAQWRKAAETASATPGLSAAADASAISLQPAPVLAAALAALSLPADDQVSLQTFLAKTYGWQPS